MTATRALRGVAIASALVAVAIVVALIAARSTSDEQAPTMPSRPVGIPSIAPNVAGPVVVAGWQAQEGAPARHLTGRVIYAGQPVANAQVRLTAEASPAIEARTDASGRFDLGEQPPRAIAIGAAAPERLAMIKHVDLRDPTASMDVELELLPCGARISGRVVDAIGDPIAHAQLLREGVVGSETDDGGTYTLCLLPTAALTTQLEVAVRADGYGSMTVGIAPAGELHRDFTLVPEATITGSAVAGAEVWIEPDRDDTRPTSERSTRLSVAADGDGHFHFAGVAGGTFKIGAAGRGTTAIAKRIRVEPGATLDVPLQMTPAAVVHGVVMSRGMPVAGAHVEVKYSMIVMHHDDPGRDPIVAGDAITQADGSFVLDGLPPGATTFQAYPVHVAGGPVTLVAGENHLTLDSTPLGKVRGVVRRHGVPVRYARVDLQGIGIRGGLMSDAEGRYEVDGLEPGHYTFYADDQQRGAKIWNDGVVLAAGETREFDLELAWGGAISGVVVDPEGKPVAGVNVRFTSTTDDQCRATTDHRGAFTCGSLAPGTFTATVHAGDNTTRPFPFIAPPSSVTVATGDAAVDGLRLVIDPRTTMIEGVVVDEYGAPASDVTVRAEGARETHYGWSPPVTVATDASGRFALGPLAPGDYDLDVRAADLSRVAGMTVAAGTTDARIVLARVRCDPPSANIVPSHRPPAPIVWDDRIELVGWDLPADARVGAKVDITFVYRVRAPIARSWSAFAHFAGSAHWRNADHDLPCPTSSWKVGDVIVDHFTTDFTQADRYTLSIGFFHRDGDAPWENLALPGDDGKGAELGTIVVE